MSASSYERYEAAVSASRAPDEADAPDVAPVHVLEAMQRHGGRFVSLLATAWFAADSENSFRLRRAFHELWDDYAAIARAEGRP